MRVEPLHLRVQRGELLAPDRAFGGVHQSDSHDLCLRCRRCPWGGEGRRGDPGKLQGIRTRYGQSLWPGSSILQILLKRTPVVDATGVTTVPRRDGTEAISGEPATGGSDVDDRPPFGAGGRGHQPTGASRSRGARSAFAPQTIRHGGSPGTWPAGHAANGTAAAGSTAIRHSSHSRSRARRICSSQARQAGVEPVSPTRPPTTTSSWRWSARDRGSHSYPNECSPVPTAHESSSTVCAGSLRSVRSASCTAPGPSVHTTHHRPRGGHVCFPPSQAVTPRGVGADRCMSAWAARR